ncbi:MAG: minor capsid protein [Clostridia bacterium]|nr:minor capsid protein [Clostridia bacterium]
MKNSTYWKKRFDEIAQIQFDKADEAEKELIKAYQKADLYIKERICLYYERYAKDYAISLYDSEKLLSVSELDDFRMTLEEFKEKAVNNQDEKWTRELEEEYLRSRISRLQALKFEINNKIKELKHEQDKINIPHLKDVYSDTFYRTAYELEKGTGIGVNFGKLNDAAIEKAIYTKWLNNKNFAGRMDDNKSNLISNLDKIITQGMILGSSSDEMVQKLMKATKISRSRAINLIQTETTYIIGRANTDMYKEFGVKEYDVIETLDSVTCETCAAMDSKRFKVSEKVEGLNAPPFHPRCRGTTVPVSKYKDIWGKGDRIARDENGVTYYKTDAGDMSYEEYMEYKGFATRNGTPEFKKKHLLKNGEQIYSNEEVMQIAKETDSLVNRYVNVSSKWSGNIKIDNNNPSAKMWNCDIRTSNITSPHEILHEQLHARSISYYDVQTYIKYQYIEEAVVELLTQEISKIEKIQIISSEYDELCNNLREINTIIKLEDNDLEFAKRLFEIPVEDRLDFLEDRIYDYAKTKTIGEMQDLNKLMEVLYVK